MNVERLEDIVYEAIANGAANDNEVEVYIRTYHARLNYDKVSDKIDEIIDDYFGDFDGQEDEYLKGITEKEQEVANV